MSWHSNGMLTVFSLRKKKKLKEYMANKSNSKKKSVSLLPRFEIIKCFNDSLEVLVLHANLEILTM